MAAKLWLLSYVPLHTLMPRATLVADANSPEEMIALEAWLARWRESLNYLSDDSGCGCCVHIYDIDGPQEAVDAIPAELSAMSDWMKEGHDHLPES